MTDDRADWQEDIWRRVRENDRRQFDETGKAVVDPATMDSAVIPDPNAGRPLPREDDPE
jgi:hypothetical protein